MLFAEQKAIRQLDAEIAERLRDQVTIRCEDGRRVQLPGMFNIREYIDQFDQARTKVKEAELLLSCQDVNRERLELRRCRYLIESECLGVRWYRHKHVLRQSNDEFLIILEECDEPETGRKRAIDFDSNRSTTKFRTRRKVTGCPVSSNRAS